jgi:ankyrin repeat protein
MDPDGSGKNALHWASRRGAATMAQILVQSGADPRVRDQSGWSSMHYASRYGHAQALKNLLGSKYGEELASSKESLGASPLHMCASMGHLDCAMCLVHSSGKPEVDVRNVFGQTPLMLAAQRGGRGFALLDMLITAGADPQKKDQDGSTAFHYAAAVGSTYALERLLRAAYRTSLAPLGGRPQPPVTIQACHNKWGESAADEAQARGKRLSRDLLLANLDLYNIDDRERLKQLNEDGSGARAGGGGGGCGGAGLSGVREDEDEDLGDTDSEEDFELDGGVVGWASVANDAEEYDLGTQMSKVADFRSPLVKGHLDGDGGVPDSERKYNDAAILESVLRKRLQNR